MRNMLLDFHITSGFGIRTHPITKKEHFHRGVDLVHPEKKVYAGISGIVTRSQFGDYGEGNYVQIKGAIEGTIFYVNNFHNKENLVEVGKEVSKNSYIAKMGQTGNTTGDHSHHEIFTYHINSKFVKSLIKDGIYHKKIGNRIFFDPIMLYTYFEINNIRY